MAQKILLRRGPIANLSGAATQQGELLLVTGSLGNLNGPFITMTGTSGTNTSTLVGKIYSGATAPALTANESALTGTPFYSTTDQVLYILDHNGNVNMDITGNLENRSVSNFDITTLTGGTATFSGDVSAANLTLSGNANIAGNIVLGGNINIGDADTDTITFGGEVTSNFIPDVDSTYNLGSTTKRWANIFVDALTGDSIGISANADIGGALTVTGNSDLQGTLTVTGATVLNDATTINSTLDVSGAVGLGSTLNVVGASTLQSSLNVQGAAILDSTLNVASNASVGGTLGVTGATTLSSTLGVTGASTLSSTLNVVGAVDFDSTLNVDGNSTLGGTLGVTGATTLSSTLGVTGATTLNGAVDINAATTISGDITLDGAGAQSITNSAGDLTITSTAGDVFIEGTQFQGNDVIIPGDLTVSGTTTTINSTEVNIGDNIITLNAAGTVADGGVQVIDTTGTAGTGSILWNATNDYWYAGVSGSTHYRIATYTNATPATNAVTKIDANKRLVASSMTDDGTTVQVGAALIVDGRVTLNDAGSPDAVGSELVYRSTANEVGYLNMTPVAQELDGVIGVNTAGELVVGNIIDGGTF